MLKPSQTRLITFHWHPNYQVRISFNAHLQVLAPHAQPMSAVATRGSLTARRTARRNVIRIIERRKNITTFIVGRCDFAIFIFICVIATVVFDIVHGRHCRCCAVDLWSFGVFGRSRWRYDATALATWRFLATRVLVDVPCTAWKKVKEVWVVGESLWVGHIYAHICSPNDLKDSKNYQKYYTTF